MLYHVTIGDRTLAVELDGGTVKVDGTVLGETELLTVPGTPVRHLIADGRSTTVIARRDGPAWSLHVDGWPVHAEVVDERTRAIQAMTGAATASAGPKPVRAPMPGLVVHIDVARGDAVRAGQSVVTMEAMKMENELKAEGAGVVARVLVEAGRTVQKGDILVEFDALPA